MEFKGFFSENKNIDQAFMVAVKLSEYKIPHKSRKDIQQSVL